jgi:hypothetical protein
VGQLDVTGAPVIRLSLPSRSHRRWRRLVLVAALVSMAHVGSPDTFFSGAAGPYPVRVSVRLPGVIPGRAQVTVRLPQAQRADDYRIGIRAGQWNVGLKGAPPAEIATAVPGDPTLYAAEIWFMTASSYQMAVDVEGPNGAGTAMVPVMAIATAERPMPEWLGAVLVVLGVVLTAGLLTLIGAAVREGVLPPGEVPDATRRRRARIATAGAVVATTLILWGGSAWWDAEAEAYRVFTRYRPFATTASVIARDDGPALSLGIRDERWNGKPSALSRYNALMPDHGKLMHLFLVREDGLNAFAHLHPVARSSQALDFDVALPLLPPGRYRVYGDIVHESGYAQTLVNTIEVTASAAARATDPDDSWLTGVPAASTTIAIGDGTQLVWTKPATPMRTGEESVIELSVRDANGAIVAVEPYMGMAAHVIVSSHDHGVFAHLHPSGSISLAALQKFLAQLPAGRPLGDAANHTAHVGPLEGRVEVPYAFPAPGRYRMWVQFKRGGQIKTAAFDLDVR